MEPREPSKTRSIIFLSSLVIIQAVNSFYAARSHHPILAVISGILALTCVWLATKILQNGNQ